jgi:hypothetical protein
LTRQDGDIRVSTSGTTIENKEIHGQLTFASGVTNVNIRCVKVVNDGYFPIDTERDNYTSPNDIVFDKVSVDCQSSALLNGAYLLFGATVRNSNSFHCIDQFRWANKVVIENNYCGNQEGPPAEDWHFDCAQTTTAKDVIIRHNSFEGRDTSDVAVWPDLGPIDNVQVEKNLLIGTPGYKIYVTHAPGEAPVSNVTVRGNRFGRGGFGPCTTEGTSPVWEDNVWNDDGSPLLRTLC